MRPHELKITDRPLGTHDLVEVVGREGRWRVTNIDREHGRVQVSQGRPFEGAGTWFSICDIDIVAQDIRFVRGSYPYLAPPHELSRLWDRKVAV